MIYITMFFVAFISGSLFPMGSEALFAYYIKNENSIYLLLIIATIGNVLGSFLNYYLGLKGEKFLEDKNILNKKSLNEAKDKFNKFGGYSLLLSSLPIIGDPLTFIAGVLEYNIKKFFIFVTISKFFRYLIIALITLSYFWYIDIIKL